MGKMKELEVMMVGNTGFEPTFEDLEQGSIPVKSLEEFVNSPWISGDGDDIFDIKTNDIISQFEFKTL